VNRHGPGRPGGRFAARRWALPGRLIGDRAVRPPGRRVPESRPRSRIDSARSGRRRVLGGPGVERLEKRGSGSALRARGSFMWAGGSFMWAARPARSTRRGERGARSSPARASQSAPSRRAWLNGKRKYAYRSLPPILGLSVKGGQPRA